MKLFTLSMLLILSGCASSGYDPHFITQEEVAPAVQEEIQVK